MVPHSGGSGAHGRLLSLLWFARSPGTMIHALTCSRSADFHRATMIRVAVAVVLLCLLWEPIRPIRNVTASALHTAGDLIAR